MSRIDEHFHLRAGKTYHGSAVMAYYLLIHADVKPPTRHWPDTASLIQVSVRHSR